MKTDDDTSAGLAKLGIVSPEPDAQPFEDLNRPWIAQEQMGPLLHAWRAYVAAGRDVERDMVR